jgi:hypothetical protein
MEHAALSSFLDVSLSLSLSLSLAFFPSDDVPSRVRAGPLPFDAMTALFVQLQKERGREKRREGK